MTKRFIIVLLLLIGALLALVACWDGTYTVKFEYPEDESYTKPYTISGIGKDKTLDQYFVPTPYRLGFYFAGWYYGETLFTRNTPVDKNITVTAKWEKHDIVINAAVGGRAEVVGGQKWPDNSTRYEIKSIADEGYYLWEWTATTAAQEDGEGMRRYLNEVIYVTLKYNEKYCEITPKFTDQITNVVMNINDLDGGIVIYPEFGIADRNFQISITANPGYYIQNYGFTQRDGENPNIINRVHNGLLSVGETSSLTANLNFKDTVFGPGTQKEFFVDFIKQDEAVIVRTAILDGDNIYARLSEKGAIRNGFVSVVGIGQNCFSTVEPNEGYSVLHWQDEEGNIVCVGNTLNCKITDLKNKMFYVVFIDAE